MCKKIDELEGVTTEVISYVDVWNSHDMERSVSYPYRVRKVYREPEGRGMIVEIRPGLYDYLVDGYIITFRDVLSLDLLVRIIKACDLSLKDLGYQSGDLCDHEKHYEVMMRSLDYCHRRSFCA